MTAVARDYLWFEDHPAGMSEAYCMTLARGLTPAEFLARIGSRPDSLPRTIDDLFEASMDLWAEYPDGGMLIGVTTAAGDSGDWALGVEINGFLGVTPEVIVPLSAGTRVVSHFRNINAAHEFYWVEDGDIRLNFDPLSSGYRKGSTPDAVIDLMREAGFDLLGDDTTGTEHPSEAALALAERLTGVHLTLGFLERATYTCGVAPTPPI